MKSKYSNKKKINNINKNSSLYDLDNFIVLSNSNKSLGKDEKLVNIFVPNYKILENKFFQLPNFVITKISEISESKIEEEVNFFCNFKGY